MSAARIDRLYRKSDPQAPREACDSCALRRGFGIVGDVHAHAMNPRQVLVTRREDLDAFGLAPGQLLENIVIAGSAEADFVPGARLRLGETAALRLTMHCEPCARIESVVSQKAIYGKRGLLAVVIADGPIRIGDAVAIDPGAYAALSEVPYERFLALLAQVPPGRVLDYRHLLLALGLTRGYLRALPRYFARARAEAPQLPLHRLVDSKGQLIPQYVPDQAAVLRAEGVAITRGGDAPGVDLARFGWTDAVLFLT